jgi:hypothetical protein
MITGKILLVRVLGVLINDFTNREEVNAAMDRFEELKKKVKTVFDWISFAMNMAQNNVAEDPHVDVDEEKDELLIPLPVPSPQVAGVAHPAVAVAQAPAAGGGRPRSNRPQAQAQRERYANDPAYREQRKAEARATRLRRIERRRAEAAQQPQHVAPSV